MNKGAQELKARLAERGSQQRLAEQLGTVTSVISGWLNTEAPRKPRADFRWKLQELLGIDPRAWDEPVDGAAA